jgi:hypothetical protein
MTDARLPLTTRTLLQSGALALCRGFASSCEGGNRDRGAATAGEDSTLLCSIQE